VWLDFVAFYEWAHASGYAEGLTLERRDVDGDYTPQNCCWIPKAQQSRNTRRYQRIEYAGRALLLCEWAEELGISYYALRHRLNRGWSVERAFTTPVQERKVA
jgi:hypothetical protein